MKCENYFFRSAGNDNRPRPSQSGGSKSTQKPPTRHRKPRHPKASRRRASRKYSLWVEQASLDRLNQELRAGVRQMHDMGRHHVISRRTHSRQAPFAVAARAPRRDVFDAGRLAESPHLLVASRARNPRRNPVGDHMAKPEGVHQRKRKRALPERYRPKDDNSRDVEGLQLPDGFTKLVEIMGPVP